MKRKIGIAAAVVAGLLVVAVAVAAVSEWRASSAAAAARAPDPHPFTGSKYITIATATYPEQIAALKTFLRERASWMDEHLR